MHYDLGGCLPQDIRTVAAFDVDARKVGRDVSEAVFAPPNCTQRLVDEMPPTGVAVQMGPVLDGVVDHMKDYGDERAFRVADAEPVDVVAALRESGAEVLVNYLPVGSEQATRRYAECCLDAGVAFVNCIPVFIVSDESWAARFEEKGLPAVGDDIKAQVGATIVHRTLSRLFVERGARLDRTYQLNTGGNTDFLNMLKRERLASKKVSKTEAVTSQVEHDMHPDDVHIGPSDYVPWQHDNKVCFIRMEGRGFAGVPLNIELRLSVEDSPNSAGVAIDAIRCVKLALDRGVAGPLTSISSYTMKHPTVQFPDGEARAKTEDFIAGRIER